MTTHSLCVQSIQAGPIGLSRFFIAPDKRLPRGVRCPIWMARIERWSRIVLDAELNCLGGRFTGKLSHDGQAKVDTRCHPTGCNDAAVFDNASPLVDGADERQQIGVCPMGRGSTPLEQSGSTEHEGTRAYGRHILGMAGLSNHEIDGLMVSDDLINPKAAGNADQVEVRAGGKGVSWHKAQAAVARYGRVGLGNNCIVD